MSDFSFEGYTCVFRGNGGFSKRDEFLLRENEVESLVPVFLYEENLDWVFVYDLDGRYSLGDILNKGERIIGVSFFVSLLELVDYCIGEFFLELDCFFLSRESVMVGIDDLEEIKLVYCPLYKSDFWDSFFSLFGGCFRDEDWFEDYLSNLSRFDGKFTIRSFISYLGSYTSCEVLEENESKDMVMGEVNNRVSIFDRGYSFLLSWVSSASPIDLIFIVFVIFFIGIILSFLV